MTQFLSLFVYHLCVNKNPEAVKLKLQSSYINMLTGKILRLDEGKWRTDRDSNCRYVSVFIVVLQCVNRKLAK